MIDVRLIDGDGEKENGRTLSGPEILVAPEAGGVYRLRNANVMGLTCPPFLVQS